MSCLKVTGAFALPKCLAHIGTEGQTVAEEVLYIN